MSVVRRLLGLLGETFTPDARVDQPGVYRVAQFNLALDGFHGEAASRLWAKLRFGGYGSHFYDIRLADPEASLKETLSTKLIRVEVQMNHEDWFEKPGEMREWILQQFERFHFFSGMVGELDPKSIQVLKPEYSEKPAAAEKESVHAQERK